MSSQVLKDPNHPLHHNLRITAPSYEEIASALKFQAFLNWITNCDEPDFIYIRSQEMK